MTHRRSTDARESPSESLRFCSFPCASWHSRHRSIFSSLSSYWINRIRGTEFESWLVALKQNLRLHILDEISEVSVMPLSRAENEERMDQVLTLYAGEILNYSHYEKTHSGAYLVWNCSHGQNIYGSVYPLRVLKHKIHTCALLQCGSEFPVSGSTLVNSARLPIPRINDNNFQSLFPGQIGLRYHPSKST